MPNHITNTLRIEGKDFGKVLDELINKDNQIDFGLVLPMPAGYIDDQRWYDWSINNWGTKWNAYETDIQDEVVRFDTAWSCPNKYYIALSKKYPEHKFHVTWYDEDLGYNIGTGFFKAGDWFADNVPEGGSKQAYELLFKLSPSIKDSFELKYGEYVYKEDY